MTGAEHDRAARSDRRCEHEDPEALFDCSPCEATRATRLACTREDCSVATGMPWGVVPGVVARLRPASLGGSRIRSRRKRYAKVGPLEYGRANVGGLPVEAG